MVYSVRNPQSHHHCNEIERDKMKRRKERRLEETLKREQEREKSQLTSKYRDIPSISLSNTGRDTVQAA